MKMYDYSSYEDYVKAQVDRWNKKKSAARSVSEYMSDLAHLLSVIDVNETLSIICHGVRNKNEVNVFKNIFPGAVIFGTDIAFSDVFMNIVKADFKDLPEEWESKFDVTYSNAIDHCYDVEKTLQEWSRCSRPGGYFVIRFSDGEPTRSDPFRVDPPRIIECARLGGLDVLDVTGLVLTARKPVL